MWLSKLCAKLFKKKTHETCKDCGYHSITGTKRYGFYMLVCGKDNFMISGAEKQENLDYTIPNRCSREW